jgi:hypothetical protein
MTIEADPWSETEINHLPYGFTLNNILTNTEVELFIVYSALWNEKAVVRDTPRGPWAFIHPDQSTVEVTNDDWKQAHPEYSHVLIEDNNQTTLAGTYNGKTVCWSRSKNSFIYRNYHRVNFTDKEEKQVSSLLDASIQSIE